MPLTNITPEQRAEMMEKAKLSKLAKKEAGKDLKQDFMDENHFRALASRYGIRLPASYINKQR